MRAGIRKQILSLVPELKDCYEPNVPDKTTEKPYAVVVQGSDDEKGEVIGFERSIEVWIYQDRTTFKSLDILMDKVIKALDMQLIEDLDASEAFTCKFGGTIGQDIIDEDWDAIARGLKFTVIALHEEDEINADPWLDALEEYTKGVTNHTVYLNSWKKNFEVPSILWRVQNQKKERENYALIKESKTLICHIASNNKNEINKLLDDIENKLITDLKIPLNLADKRYLTIESISEDREADMLSKGQLTLQLFRRRMIENNTPIIKNIYGSGVIREE